MKLENKAAIITGSSKGMGKAIATLFAREGAQVVINYKSSVDQAQEVANMIINDIGGRAIVVQADVSTVEGIDKLFEETLNSYGTIDILVNNAGIEHPQDFLNISFEDLEKIFHTNTLAPFLTSTKAVKIMKEKDGGKIINIASVRGLKHMGRVGNMDYSMSKAAVINMTTTMAKAVAPEITVNAVAPGPTDTDMAKTWSQEHRQQKINNIKIGRLMDPDEIANACLYFASDAANGVTGEILVVDGGYSLGRD